MDSDFSRAQSFTAQWEGGLSEHPADPGGITKYGVSLRWLRELAQEECHKLARTCDGSNAYDHSAKNCRGQSSPNCRGQSSLDFDGDGDIDADDIRACTFVQAEQLFKKHFWDATKCANLPSALAVVLYDGAVNMGAPRAVRQLQQALNTVAEAHLDHFVPIAEDAINGPKTQDMADALAACDMDFYTARHLVRLREKFYRELVQRRGDLKPFLKGWQNRCTALVNYLAQLEREV